MIDISRNTYRLSVGAMFLALTLICLYLTSVLPVMTLSLYFISSLFVIPLLTENEPGLALVMAAAASLLSLLLVPNFLLVLPYVFLFGHYGVAKYYFEKGRKKRKVLIQKLLYFNAGLALIYFVCFQIVAGEWLSSLAWYWLLLIAQPVFFLYDWLYSKIGQLYYIRLRKFLKRV